MRIYQEIVLRGAQSSMSSTAWVDMFLMAVKGRGVENLNEDGLFRPLDPVNRKWIVPKIALEAGREISVPRNYDANAFRPIRLSDIEEILTFFLTQRFREVYVFGWDYGDIEDKNKIERINGLIRSMGKRAMNLFWVSDQPTPREWVQIFSRMTKISVRDGLNRVSAQ